MVAGKPLVPRQRRKISRAVARAEAASGLEFCVYVGPVAGDPREQAERMFAELGLPDRPGVLLLVAPPERRFEVLPSVAAAARIRERDLLLAVAALRASFGVGDVAGGVAEAVRLLAQAAGPPRGSRPAEFPDVLGPG